MGKGQVRALRIPGQIKLHKTRFSALCYGRVDHTDWSFYDVSDGDPARVGPLYRSRRELLADLERYAIDAGWVREAGEG